MTSKKAYITSKPLAVFAATGIALASLTAFADSHKHCPGHMNKMMSMEMMDQNKDGELSTEEMKQFHANHFKSADANKDGTVDLSEFQIMHEKEAKRREETKFKSMDTNADGKLSVEEMNKRHTEMMTRCDANKDGKISQEEMKTCHPMPSKMHGRKTTPESEPTPKN